MKKPTDRDPITAVLEWYSEKDPSYGRRLAEYLDWLEDCFAYTLTLTDGEEQED